MSAHTPGPWRVAAPVRILDTDARGQRYIHAKDCTIAVMLDGQPGDAEFIVRACNAHDDLLAALERVTDLFQMAVYIREARDGKEFPLDREEITSARAVIAKARGES